MTKSVCDPSANFYGMLGVSMSIVLANLGAAYGTAKSGVGIANLGIMRPDMVMRSLIPVVMAGVLGIYGLITAVIINGKIHAPSYSAYSGYAHLAAGLTVGMSSLAAGMAIGVVGDAGVHFRWGCRTMAKFADDLFEAEEGARRSINWDLDENLSDAEKRRLVPGMAEVGQLMQQDGLTFDEARFKMVARQMELMGVDPSGMPLDPKAFTFEKDRPVPPKLSDDWGSLSRSTGSRRGYQTVHTPTGEPPMPRLPVDLPKVSDSGSPRKSIPSFKWMAACYKIVKPVLRGTMFLRAVVFFLLVVLVLLLRLFQGTREPHLPSMLFQQQAAANNLP